MNRRVANDTARDQEGRQVQLHEAGHAVGRIIVAAEFGVPPEDMIDSIEMGCQQHLPGNDIAGLEYISQAVTIGPGLSEDLNEIFTWVAHGSSGILKHDIARAVAVAKQIGIDVDRWIRARLLCIVMGPVAEAHFTDQPVRDVWTAGAAAGDREDAKTTCVEYAGCTSAQADLFIDEALDRAQALIAQSNVQRSVQLLAGQLPTVGTMSGREAARIVLAALSSFDEVADNVDDSDA